MTDIPGFWKSQKEMFATIKLTKREALFLVCGLILGADVMAMAFLAP